MTTEEKNLKEFLRNGTPANIVERYLSLSQIAESQKFGELDTNVVVVDTEATGLSFTRDDLIQIAAARITDGKISDWYVTFAHPDKPISEEIENLTHIGNDDIADAPTPDEAVAKLVEFCGDAVMLAHNASFDKEMITKHVSGYPLLESIWLDSLDLTRVCFPRLTSHRLLDLSRAFSLVQSTHRADDDVATTVEVYRLCLAAISQMPLSLVRVISNLADVDMWPSAWVFQKMYEAMSEYLSADDGGAQTTDVEIDLFSNDPTLGKVDMFSMLKSFREQNRLNIPKKDKFDVDLAGMPSVLPDDNDIELQEPTITSAIDPDSMQFLPEDEIAKNFEKDGLLGKIYEDFEQREEQTSMALAVHKSMRDSQNCVVEAGTGVGKSMAYLIPASKIAMDNKITIGIATKTNALLDQLIYHELPALKEKFPELEYSSLKGAKHYICLRKAAILAGRPAKMVTFKNEEFCNASSIAGLLSFIEQTAFDDCDNLRINGRSLFASQYTTQSHECLRNKCPFFHNGCFVHGARRIAKNSDLVVTNHTLMLCDINADGGILPPIKYWVVDEAHGLEAEARHVFSHEISAGLLLETAKNMDSENVAKNPFVKCSRMADSSKSGADGEDKNTIFRLVNKCKSTSREFGSKATLLANNLDKLLAFAPKKNSGYEFCDIWIGDYIRESQEFNDLYKIAEDFYKSAENCLVSCNNLIDLLDSYESLSVCQREIGAFVFQLKALMDAAEVIFFKPSDAYVYSATLNTKNFVKANKLSAQLMSVGSALRDGLYEPNNSIILTSATMAISEDFQPYFDSVGLNSDTPTLQLRSSFDFDNNMRVYAASDIASPQFGTHDQYMDELCKFLVELHRASGGSILTLFTNRRDMEAAHTFVSEALRENGLRVLVQKYKLSAKAAKDEFLKEKTVSLFALKTFWEGFDAPGDTLRGVVITRLPFAPPSDPLSIQRKETIANSWAKFDLPTSVIEVKQAVGRLIRKATDKGFIVFADSRLCTKGYGAKYLGSMPTKNVCKMTMDEIVIDVYNIYGDTSK